MRSITEVWDYRLSTAQPMNYREASGVPGVPDSHNWVAVIYGHDGKSGPLEVHDTGIPATEGDLHDGVGLDACYAFYRTVRDKYARPDIEKLKEINAMRGQ